MILTMQEIKEFNNAAVVKYEKALSDAKEEDRTTPSLKATLDYYNSRLFILFQLRKGSVIKNKSNIKQKSMATRIIAIANINIGTRTVEEDFNVESEETAEAEVKEVVNYFNSTLKTWEHPRTFEGIVRFEKKYILEPEDDDDYGDGHGDDDLEDDEY